MRFDIAGKKVFLAGHNGMVGSAIFRRLSIENCDLITAPRQELDLSDGSKTREFMLYHRPDIIIMAAARVGGIVANNTYPVEFLYENLNIQNSVLAAAHEANVARLLFLGSSCIYPKHADQPIKEEALLTGPLEATNEAYAIAKIAGLKLVEAYRRQYGRDWISAMPTNLYGPGDSYHPENSHVLPALIRKFHEAKISGANSVTIWGSGAPRREFMHSDDLADALVFLLKNFSGDQHINVGTSDEVSIKELAMLIMEITQINVSLNFDPTKPDGTPRKLMDSSKLKSLGWAPKMTLRDGIKQLYDEHFGKN